MRALRRLLALFPLALLMACTAQVHITMSPAASDATSPSASPPSSSSTTDYATPAGPPPTPTLEFPGDGPWDVAFETEDGVTLQGRLFGQGTTAVVLAPMYPGQRAAWYPFARVAAEHGYRVLTFDFRDYGVMGEGDHFVNAPVDLAAAVAFLREHDSERIMLIGASQGGIAAIRFAAIDSTISGLVVISSARSFGGLEITDADLAALTVPSLWLGTRVDMNQRIEEMAGLAGGSDKEMWIYEGSSLSGTYIFEGADSADLMRRLLEFLDRVSGM